MEQRSEVYKALVLLKATRGQQAAACAGAAALGSVLGQRALGFLGGQPRCILPKRCSPLVVTHQVSARGSHPSRRGAIRGIFRGATASVRLGDDSVNNACAESSRVGLLGRLPFCGQAPSLMPGEWALARRSVQAPSPHPTKDIYTPSPFILFLSFPYRRLSRV